MSKLLTNSWLAPELLPLLLLPITGIAAAVALLPIGSLTGDMVTYFIPWMDAVQDGGLASTLSANISETPSASVIRV